MEGPRGHTHIKGNARTESGLKDAYPDSCDNKSCEIKSGRLKESQLTVDTDNGIAHTPSKLNTSPTLLPQSLTKTEEEKAWTLLSQEPG